MKTSMVVMLLTALTGVVVSIPSPFLPVLDPLTGQEQLQLEQAIRSDCPRKLVPKLIPNCPETVEECRNETGQVVANPDQCKETCAPEEYCEDHPYCNWQMKTCLLRNCAPVKVTKCPPEVRKSVELRKICTPTLSLSCSKQHHKKCGSGGFNECVLKAAGCEQHMSNHCTTVPVFKGTRGKCTLEIERDCTQKNVDDCNATVLDECREQCQKPAIKCENKCPKNITCTKIPSQSCYRMEKERVCE